MYLVTFILLGLMVLLGFIAVFVPWAMKDIGVNQRAWAYPFKTCIEDTSSKVNLETCMDNDFIEPTGVPLTGGSDNCKAFILTTIAFVFINVILGVVLLLALLYVMDQLWKRPVLVGAAVQVGLVIVCIAAFLAWIFFIVYAEMTCAPNSIFPVHGYSYGFILSIFASALAVAAVVTGFLALKIVYNYQEVEDDSTLELESPVIPPPGAFPEYPHSGQQNRYHPTMDGQNQYTPARPLPTMSFNQGGPYPVY